MRDLYPAGARGSSTSAVARPKQQFAAYKDAELVHPELGFEGALTLQFGGLTFQIVEEGSAHSSSDVTMFIPQRRIMTMGDLLNTEIHPGPGELAQVFFSNARNWITLLDRIIARQPAGRHLHSRPRARAYRPRRRRPRGAAALLHRHA